MKNTTQQPLKQMDWLIDNLNGLTEAPKGTYNAMCSYALYFRYRLLSSP